MAFEKLFLGIVGYVDANWAIQCEFERIFDEVYQNLPKPYVVAD